MTKAEEQRQKLRELKERIEALKMQTGQWKRYPGREATVGPPGRYLDVLQQMKGVLEGEVGKNKNLLGRLIELKNRMEHGGSVSGD